MQKQLYRLLSLVTLSFLFGFSSFTFADKIKSKTDKTEIDDDCDGGLNIFAPETIMERVGSLTISDKFVARWKRQLVSFDKFPDEDRKILMLLLLALIESPGEVLSPEYLYEEAWAEAETGQSPALAVERAISQLQAAFIDVDKKFDRISMTSDGRYFWKAGDANDEDFGSATINSKSKIIKWKGKRVDLSPGEFEVVEKLIRSSNHSVALPELYKLYFGKPPVIAVRAARDFRPVIDRIRQVFKQVDDNFASLRSLRKRSFKWLDIETYDNSQKPEEIRVGRLTLLPREKKALWDDKQVNRTPRQFRIIEALATSATGRLTSERLRKLVRRGPESQHPQAERKLRTEVMTIVRLFTEIDPEFSGLEIIRGFGYYWRK